MCMNNALASEGSQPFLRQSAHCTLLQVGMQNSALGAVLAAVHFSEPLTAVPCALSACLHSLMGSVLAAAWQASDKRSEPSIAL